MKDTVSRFAPSPTGRLHLGHAYSALLAHDFARSRGGAFLLRIEDIDPARSRPEHVDAILEDLIWLGIQWDGEIVYQSERLHLYAAALKRLWEQELVYPCFCTRASIAAEIAASAAAPHGPDGPLYPGTCRLISEKERAERRLSEPHAWRLDMKAAADRAGTLYWMDGYVQVEARPQAFGDVVLTRKDAPTSYHLAVVVDDAAQGVTDVVRGRDLYHATHVHRLLQALLDLPTPHYHHHTLLADAEGKRLAKRYDAPTMAAFRAAGVDGKKLAASLLVGHVPEGYRIGAE